MVNKIGANKAFYVLFAIFAIGLYMLFSLVTKIAPLTVSHTVYYCQKAINNILLTLPHALPPLLTFILLSIFIIGFTSLALKLLRTALFIRKIMGTRVITPKKIGNITKELKITTKVDVVESDLYSPFCYGLLKPRICISLKLVNSLSTGEIKTVLLHESYHLNNKDPLKILLSEIAASMFFFVPILKDIRNYYILSKEIAADQLAVKLAGVENLRLVLIKILSSPTPVFSGVASFGSYKDLEQRVCVLASNHKIRVKVSLLRLSISLTFFIFAIAALNLPVYAIEDSHETHAYFICPYGGERVFTPATYSPNN